MIRATATLLCLLLALTACGKDDAPKPEPEKLPFESQSVGSMDDEPDEPRETPGDDPTPTRDPVAESKAKSYTETIAGTDVTFEMVWVPDQKLWIGKTEVTWDEYEIYALGEETPEGVDAVSRPSRSYHPYDRGWGVGKRPACGMTRHAAVEYCTWLSKRTGKTYTLPSSKQWQAVFDAWRIDGKTTLRSRAWFAGNSSGKTQEVGTLKPNRLGIHDMLGNVLEYTTDTAPEDDNGDTWPILRGGSFDSPATKVDGKSPQPQLFIWHEREPQRPRSQWWLCDGPFTGFRVMRLASPASGGSSK